MAAVSTLYFPGIAQATLESWLTQVLQEIAYGKVNLKWSSTDTTCEKWIDPSLPPERRRDMLLNDLAILDPVTWAGVGKVTRTVPRYTL